MEDIPLFAKDYKIEEYELTFEEYCMLLDEIIFNIMNERG